MIGTLHSPLWLHGTTSGRGGEAESEASHFGGGGAWRGQEEGSGLMCASEALGSGLGPGGEAVRPYGVQRMTVAGENQFRPQVWRLTS